MVALTRTQSLLFNLKDDHYPIRAKRINEGSAHIIGFNCSNITNSNKSTVSSVVWTQQGNSIALSGSASTANTAQITVTATVSASGSSRLKAVITFSDNQIYVRYIDVHVSDLERGDITDYRDNFYYRGYRGY